MNKVIIIGCPGSGKSTFARTLQERTGLPLYYLDQMYWRADRTSLDQELFREILQAALAQEKWIIDGNFASTMEMRLAACDTVFFLDYSLEVCLSGVDARRGKSRPDMPWTETALDPELVTLVQNYARDNRPQILSLLAQYPDKHALIFTARQEAEQWLSRL